MPTIQAPRVSSPASSPLILFPAELVSLFMQSLSGTDDTDTLRTSSLVNRTFRSATDPFLFETIYLKDQSLSLGTDSIISATAAFRENVQTIVLQSRFLDSHWSTLLKVVPSYEHLNHLTLRSPRGDHVWIIDAGDTLAFFQLVGPKLRRLTCQDLTISYRILSLCSKLDTLSFMKTFVHEAPEIEALVLLESFGGLKTLILDDTRNLRAEYESAWSTKTLTLIGVFLDMHSETLTHLKNRRMGSSISGVYVTSHSSCTVTHIPNLACRQPGEALNLTSLRKLESISMGIHRNSERGGDPNSMLTSLIDWLLPVLRTVEDYHHPLRKVIFRLESERPRRGMEDRSTWGRYSKPWISLSNSQR